MHTAKLNTSTSKLALPAMIVLIIFSLYILPAQLSAATNGLIVGDFRLQDSLDTDVPLPLVNTPLFFSIKITNNDNEPQPYVAVFDIRDSRDYSISLILKSGNAEKYSSTTVRADWLPDIVAPYVVRAFVVSGMDSPKSLSPVIVKSFEVRAAKPVPSAEPLQTEQQQQTADKPLPTNGESAGAPSLNQLRQYALRKVNQDRADFGLSPVKLSTNQAAQVHADDVFKTRRISHWMTNGEKPYMTYSRLGGQGDVSQNVATAGDMAYYKDCVSGDYICDPIEPVKEIDHLEYIMMYNDTVCCNDGHRENILDPHHTDVSIGIAYDDYTFVIVQNFENNYIVSYSGNDGAPVFSYQQKSLSIQGKIIDGEVKWRELGCDGGRCKYTVPIRVYHDALPSNAVYKEHANDTSYSLGDEVACVIPGTLSGNLSCNPEQVLGANWNYNDSPDNDSFSITVNLVPVLQESGVYTVLIFAEPPNTSGNVSLQFPVAAYSVWYTG